MTGFASLLKRKVSTKHTEDIVSIIDKQCMSRSSYDFEKVRESLSRLNSYSKKEDREDDEFMRLFFKFFNEMYADRPRTKGVFHPSGISGACERAIYYEFTGEEESDKVIKKHSPQTQRTFDSGTWWHTYIQMLLWKAGILEKSEVKVVSRRRRIHGHCDGILRLDKRTLLEIKTMNSFSYYKGKLKPFLAHEIQAGVYATELELKQICFLYINKDTSEITVHIVPVNRRLVGGAYDKMERILESVSNKKVPRRLICKTDTSANAKTCPYCTLCFSTKK